MKKTAFASIFFVTIATSAIAGDPRAAADVVARNLDSWIGQGFGHIGIWTGSSVLEVLNEPVVIQTNTLSNFKTRTSFWGARYGISGNYAAQIISAGYAQRNYSPTYTLSASYTEGGKINYSCIQYDRYGQCVRYVKSQTRGVFRCDTFVNYAFLKGSGYLIIQNWNPITPSILFGKFPYSR